MHTLIQHPPPPERPRQRLDHRIVDPPRPHSARSCATTSYRRVPRGAPPQRRPLISVSWTSIPCIHISIRSTPVDALGRRLADRPSTIAHDASAVARNVARVREREPLRSKAAASCDDQRTADREMAASIGRADRVLRACLDRHRRPGVVRAGRGVGLEVREVGAYDQERVVAPDEVDGCGDRLGGRSPNRSGIAGSGPKSTCRNGSSTSSACSGACGASSATARPAATSAATASASTGTSPRGVAKPRATARPGPGTGRNATGRRARRAGPARRGRRRKPRPPPGRNRHSQHAGRSRREGQGAAWRAPPQADGTTSRCNASRLCGIKRPCNCGRS